MSDQQISDHRLAAIQRGESHMVNMCVRIHKEMGSKNFLYTARAASKAIIEHRGKLKDGKSN